MASSFFSTRGLAQASARRPWRTLGIWLLLIVIAAGLQGTMGSALNNEANFTNDPDSQHGSDLIDERMGSDPLSETIVVTAADKTVDDPAFQQVVEQTTADLMGMTEVVASASNFYLTRQQDPDAANRFVSEDRHSSIISVTLAGGYDDYTELSEHGAEFVETAEGHAGNGIAVYAVGDLSGGEVYGEIAEEDIAQSEQVGLPVALLVLIVVFGALVAAGIPILLGIVSIAVAMGLTAIVSQVVDISEMVTIMITMIGLAVGIDYALFLLERYREERRHGMAKHDAIALAGGTAGKAVFFSGGTVVLALMGMFLVPVSIFHSLAAGAILAVIVAVFATQTFIPALVSLIGDKIDWPRRRKYDAATVEAQRRYDRETIHRGFWGRVTRTVMNNPVAALVISLGILIVAAAPVFSIETGQPGIESLPESNVKTGFEILARDFYAGSIGPVQFVVDGESDARWVTDGVQTLTTTLADNPLYGPATVTTAERGDLTIVEIPMGIDPNSQAAFDEIDTLRDEIVPTAFGEHAGAVYVTGASAFTVDFNDALTDYTPLVFAFVLGLSFLLLMMAFRSVVVPAKAIVMNLLSVGAAYGLVVAVFQHGWGADLFGFEQTDSIAAWLPIFLFCVLFGLSMDYHVFLLSRIREHYDQTHRNEESVAVGLQATGKIITGAALIMVAVFGAFAAGRLVDIQQMGFGLAVAVLLDATIVRSILVPSAMKLLGDRNWYLPRWLRWIPDLRIEGAPVHPAPQPTPQSAPAGD
ncbi:MAG: MMPL family transporter [Thermomicrobiales bacterium]